MFRKGFLNIPIAIIIGTLLVAAVSAGLYVNLHKPQDLSLSPQPSESPIAAITTSPEPAISSSSTQPTPSAINKEAPILSWREEGLSYTLKRISSGFAVVDYASGFGGESEKLSISFKIDIENISNKTISTSIGIRLRDGENLVPPVMVRIGGSSSVKNFTIEPGGIVSAGVSFFAKYGSRELKFTTGDFSNIGFTVSISDSGEPKVYKDTSSSKSRNLLVKTIYEAAASSTSGN